ncbi:signal peptidase II [Flavobacteriaceae bacterium AH-315-B10]|nr:signal peptidase II [Flavobacteriaceae bacterium AH-315-B10]
MKLSRRSIFIWILIVFNIAIDQISKFLTRAYIEAGSVSEIIGDYFTLHNVENSGAFLGMGSELNPTIKIILLNILPIIVLSFVLRYVFKDKTIDKLSLIGFSCILGGGIANIFDRIRFGSVTDFFHIDLGGVFRTGIFNLADLSVTTGMIMILTASFIYRKKNVSE